MPHFRPMPAIGPRVYELRVTDSEASVAWRVIFRIDGDAIVVAHWFEKKMAKAPGPVVAL